MVAFIISYSFYWYIGIIILGDSWLFYVAVIFVCCLLSVIVSIIGVCFILFVVFTLTVLVLFFPLFVKVSEPILSASLKAVSEINLTF